MIVTQTLTIPIYCRMFHVIISGDFLNDLPEINKKYHQELTEKDNVLGMSQKRGGHHLVIINVGKHRKTYKGSINIESGIAETISHEAAHATNQLFESIGAVVDQNNDEAQAYLLGWFVNQTTRNYLKFKAQEDVKKI